MLGRTLLNYWVPLRFQPPLFLQPLLEMNENVVDYDMASKVHHWERLKETHGYFDYIHDEPGHRTTSDLRVPTKVQNFMIVGGQ